MLIVITTMGTIRMTGSMPWGFHSPAAVTISTAGRRRRTADTAGLPDLRVALHGVQAPALGMFLRSFTHGHVLHN
ncbi:hypothetical protein ACFYRD_40355 [Streptomyces hirsutus]|uniref:hypothetical protein n=1 Tax=Streptomyces hirsutus TaxID=35620 RepID=UPI0036D00CF2